MDCAVVAKKHCNDVFWSFTILAVWLTLPQQFKMHDKCGAGLRWDQTQFCRKFRSLAFSQLGFPLQTQVQGTKNLSNKDSKWMCIIFWSEWTGSLVQVTDGVQSLEAMEYQPVPALSTALRWGTGVQQRCDVSLCIWRVKINKIVCLNFINQTRGLQVESIWVWAKKPHQGNNVLLCNYPSIHLFSIPASPA